MGFIKKAIASIESRVRSTVDYYEMHTMLYRQYYNLDVCENSYFFESFGGNFFVGDPYYIFQYLFMHDTEKRYRFYISSKDVTGVVAFLKKRNEFDERVSIVAYKSVEYIRALNTTQFLVNNMSFPMDFIKKKEQYILYTPHGKVYKNDALVGDRFGKANPQRNYYISDYITIGNELSRQDILMSGVKKEFINAKIYTTGVPRNSILFDCEKRENLRKQYALGKKVVLYMPTWRNSGSSAVTSESFDVGESLAKHLGEEYTFYLKLHQIEMTMSNRLPHYGELIPAELEPYEVMCMADVMITDYSSAFLDYINVNENVLLYQYDKEEYEDQRGIRGYINSLIPYPILKTEKEMVDAIMAHHSIDNTSFKAMECQYDNKNAVKSAVDLLLSRKPRVTQHMSLYIVDRDADDDYLRKVKARHADENIYFVFVLGFHGVHYENVQQLSKLNDLIIYKEDRLNFWEKLSGILFPNSEYSRKAAEREVRRMWGDNTVSTIYTKSKKTIIPQRLKMLGVPIYFEG